MLYRPSNFFSTFFVFLFSLFSLTGGELSAQINDFRISPEELREIHPAAIISSQDLSGQELKVLYFPSTTDEVWIRIDLKDCPPNAHLIISNSLIDSLAFYQLSESGELLKYVETGDHYNFYQRDINHPKFVFQIEQAQGPQTLYLQIRSKDQLFLPISLKSGKDTMVSLGHYNIFKGIYFGIVLVMFLYNLLIAIITRDDNYFTYSFYIIFLGLAQASLESFTFKYLFPYNPLVFNHAVILFSSLAGVLGTVFAMKFLDVRRNAPKWLAGLYVFIVTYAIAWVLDLVGLKNISNIILNINGLTIGLYALAIAAVIARKGVRSANLFLIAYSLFVLGFMIYVLGFVGVFPVNAITNNALAAGSAAQIILLSIALAERINLLRKEKEESQAEALRVSRENERIIREQNLMLEQKVQERTLELQEANEELKVTLSNLRDTQTQLVDAEKMASLGQLTAGIAHEINNPINFVTSNITPLVRDLDEMYEIIDAYAAVESIEDGEALKRARNLSQEYELTYLKEEIGSLVKGIKDGANRTSEIVKGLRTFSRLDEDVLKQADVHEGLSSTLVLLRSKMKGSVEVKFDYDQNLPMIDCMPGKLNQVFMNILNNAVYAVQHKNYAEGEKPEIALSTSAKDDQVKVSIKDNGIGMDEQTRKKMFDPFFTTKEVGEGTGLGMSIVYKIIEKHRGRLDVKSEMGVGTEFIINLPVRQPNKFE